MRGQGVRTVAVLHSDDPFYRKVLERKLAGDPAIQFDEVVPVSRFLHAEAARLLGPEFPNVVIPCGVAPSPGKAAPPGSEFRLVYVGRLAQEQKRILDVVAALAAVIDQIPGTSADLIGAGPDRAAAETVAMTCSHPERIRFLGALPPSSVRERLPTYHAQLLLSAYEGLPVALIEGMSAGLVPLVTRIRSGVEELVRDGESGFFVDAAPQSVVDAVRRLKGDSGLWTEISKAAALASAPFGAQRCAEEWAALLKRLAGDRTGRTKLHRPVRIPRPRWCPEFAGDLQDRWAAATIVRRWSTSLRMRAGRWRRNILRRHGSSTAK
jgi:colanic acid/amylovoran biosynthesis glycosyltransferase